MSDPQINSDLRAMQSRLVAEFLELAAAAQFTPHFDSLTLCAILAHPDTKIQAGGV